MRGIRLVGIAGWLFAATCAWAQTGTKPIAVVNGEAIPRSEFDAVQSLRPRAVTPQTASQTKADSEQIVNSLVEEVLLRQFLAKHTPPAKADEIEKQFAELGSALKAQKKTIADYCKETMQTEKQIRANIESMMRWSAYLMEHRTDDDLKAYYEANKDFFDKVTVKCSHIVFRIGIEAPPAERAEALKRMQDLRQQIVAGKIAFAEAAQKFSQCPSASKGGSLGYIYRKWMVEEPFAKAAFALKVNEISDVVVTDYGVHLIQVHDRKPPEPSDFAKIKDDVRDCCGEEMRQKLLIDLRKNAKIEMNLP